MNKVVVGCSVTVNIQPTISRQIIYSDGSKDVQDLGLLTQFVTPDSPVSVARVEYERQIIGTVLDLTRPMIYPQENVDE